MGSDAQQRWEVFSGRVGPELMALVERHCPDPALAREVTGEVLESARPQVEAGIEPSEEDLQLAVLRLAIRRLREQRREVPPALGVEVQARTWPGATQPDDPALVAAALARLPAPERIALLLRHVREFSIKDAARFFELSRRRFLRLLAQAHKRLLEEYARLREGAGVVVGVVVERALRAWRRAQAALARAPGALDQGWARLSSLPMLEAFSATAAVALTTLTLATGPSSRENSSITPAAAPVARMTLAAAQMGPVPAPPVVAVEDVVPVPVASAPVEDASQPAAIPVTPPLVVDVSKETNAEDRTTYQTETRTLVEVGYEAPVPPPDDPSGQLPEEPGVGVDVGVFYHCPPPDERPPPQALACPVLEP